MYSAIYLLLLVFGSVQLEEHECKIEGLTVTEVSTTTLTVTWAKSPLKDCGHTVIYLGEETRDNIVELRIMRSLTSATFTALEPCSHYYIDVFPLTHNAQFNFNDYFITIHSTINITQLVVLRSPHGTYVIDTTSSVTWLVAVDYGVNSECYPNTDDIDATDVTEADSAVTSEITPTSPFVMQSTSERVLETNTTTSKKTIPTETTLVTNTTTSTETILTETTLETNTTTSTETIPIETNLETNTTTSTETTLETNTTTSTETIPTETTLEKDNTETKNTDRSVVCTVKDLKWEVDSLNVLVSQNSVEVHWINPLCTLGMYMISLTQDSGRDVREMRVVRNRNSTQFLDLEDCHTYTISVTPLTGESLLRKTNSVFSLTTRISRIRSVNIITAVKNSSSTCNPAILSFTSNEVAVIVALTLSTIVIAVIVVLRYRGLAVGGERWGITDDWRFVRETRRDRNQGDSEENSITLQESPV